MSSNLAVRNAVSALAVMAMVVVMAAPAAAQDAADPNAGGDKAVTVSANAGWVSQYFYRGILQKTSSASAGLNLGAGALSLGTWLADVGDGTEVDLFGSVGGEVGGLSLSAGGTAYLYTGQFDDTYKEVNLGAGYGPLSVAVAVGRYDNFGAGTEDYVFTSVTAAQSGFYGTVGMFGKDFSGNYGEVGYGFSAADLDWKISGILSDSELSGHHDALGSPTPGLTLVFGVTKVFSF